MSDIVKLPKFHIYSDESSQTQHRYLVIGATVCSAGNAYHIAKDINDSSAFIQSTSELKWGKVKKHNLSMYREAVTAYFERQSRNDLQFYALVVDTSKADHNTYNDGDKEIGFSKYLFTLLYKFARIWTTDKRYYVFLDDRTTKHTPDATKRMLNTKARKERGATHDIYRNVEFCKSHVSRLIQLTDLMTGAIAFETNRHHEAPGAARHKIELMNLITEKAGLRTLSKPSPYSHQGFDIWHLDFSKSKKKR